MQRKWKVVFAVVAVGLLGLAIIEGVEASMIKTEPAWPEKIFSK